MKQIKDIFEIPTATVLTVNESVNGTSTDTETDEIPWNFSNNS